MAVGVDHGVASRASGTTARFDRSSVPLRGHRRRRARAGFRRAHPAADRGPRHVRAQEQRQHADPLGEAVEHENLSRSARSVVLGQVPRPRLLDVAVQSPDPGPDRLQRLGQLGAVEQLRTSASTPARPSSPPVSSRVELRLGHDAVAVALEHRQRAAGEVAPVVGELGLVPGLESRRRDAAVLAEGDLAKQ